MPSRPSSASSVSLWFTLAIVLAVAAPIVRATNPAITDAFTADPAAMVYKGVVYLYVGHDEAKDGENRYVMHNWLCYSSTDMVHWTSHGSPLAVKDFAWAKADAWAGQVIERNGKFYWYVPMEHATIPGKAIGVAVSDTPTGPFHDARGSALVTNDMTTAAKIPWDDIDPTVFIDHDGQAWLFWGNQKCYYAKLKENMVEFDGPIHVMDLPHYTEAPWLHERNGIYYLSYASGFPERIAYATAPSVTGPWTYRGVIAEVAGNSNTIHQAIIEYNGQWYFIYHNGATQAPNTGGSYRRSVCIDYLYYNPDGTIRPVQETTAGVSIPPHN